jgi:chemotaxis protein CheD
LRPHAVSKLGLPNTSVPPLVEDQHAVSSTPHFLHAGQVFVSGEGKPIVMILGSCVGICIWDPASGVGGATHFLLPSWDGRGARSARYGDVAVSVLLQKLIEAGADRAQLRAKVFGGGCLFDSLRQKGANGEQHLGSRNIEVALQLLTKARIQIVSTQPGKDRGQRIAFRTDNGETLMKTL